MKANDTVRNATVLALTTAVISGTVNFLNKFAVSTFSNPVLFTTLKNSLVAVFILGVFLVFRRWSEVKSLTSRQWARLLAIGFVGGSIPFALFFTGLAQTSAVNGALIHKTLFLWVAVLAVPFLKERMTWPQWLGIATIFAANFFVGGFTGFKFNLGEFLILTATVLWAVENIIAKIALKEISSLTVAAGRMIFGSVLLLVYVSFFGGFGETAALSAAQWGWILLTSALLAGYVLTWYTALKYAPATYVATLLVPATLVTNVLSAVFITHSFTGQNLSSGLLYAIGVSLVILFVRRINYTEHSIPALTP